MRHPAYSLLCRVSVGIRLATGFLVAGLVAVLAVCCVGLLPTHTAGPTASLQQQLSAANADVTTALVLFQANENSVRLAIEDAATGQSRSVLLSDQAAAQERARQYEAEIATFVREHLLAQQPAQQGQLSALGQAEAVEQQRGLVMSVTYTWQQYDAAQTRILQDLLADQLATAELLARFQAGPLATDALSALDSLLQFQGDLALSVQQAANRQVRQQQQVVTLLGAAAALLLILLVGLLVTLSLVIPLHRLRQVTQAVAAGENEARVAVIGQDEVAAISLQVNGWLTSLASLLAEVSRQHDGQIAAAEVLAVGVSGDDTGAVRKQVAEVGDALRVLDTVCGEVVARFQGVVAAAHVAAGQLETLALQMQRQAEPPLLDSQNLPTAFVKEVLATAQQLEALSHVLAASLPGSDKSAA